MESVIARLRIRKPKKGTISDGEIIFIDPVPDQHQIFDVTDSSSVVAEPIVIKSGATFRFPGEVQFVSIVYSGSAFISTESDESKFKIMTPVYLHNGKISNNDTNRIKIGFVLDGGVRCDRILVDRS